MLIQHTMGIAGTVFTSFSLLQLGHHCLLVDFLHELRNELFVLGHLSTLDNGLHLLVNTSEVQGQHSKGEYRALVRDLKYGSVDN